MTSSPLRSFESCTGPTRRAQSLPVRRCHSCSAPITQRGVFGAPQVGPVRLSSRRSSLGSCCSWCPSGGNTFSPFLPFLECRLPQGLTWPLPLS